MIGFVTNAGFLDGAAMDGLRKCFSEEFSEIYIFNLRGNQRTQGEISRKEGGKIFGSGSRAPITITILVKNPESKGAAKIFYYVYGFLHLPGYREKFSAELKKSLPRIFLVDEPHKFGQLAKASRALTEIHLNYEDFEKPAGVEVDISAENYFVKKMKLSADKKTLHYNADITIKNISPKVFDYKVNGRSPVK